MVVGGVGREVELQQDARDVLGRGRRMSAARGGRGGAPGPGRLARGCAGGPVNPPVAWEGKEVVNSADGSVRRRAEPRRGRSGWGPSPSCSS